MHRPSKDLTDSARNLEESRGPPSPSTPDPDVDERMPSVDEDTEPYDGHVFTPPPHIAARFYRPSHARRKESAASSRRNSISSINSRSSSHNYGRHGSDQSKQVAQHLRRASFLEDRKARLADRAAHAEKVRLRAALAKATMRDTTQSEERALAAHQARQEKLAEIVASCAEEVKRAKAVAENIKEKREQELAKMRAQMEERMAEADRRREELRSRNAAKRSRGQSITNRKTVDVMPQVKEKELVAMSEGVAAGKLQWWWRGILRKRAVREFLNLGLAIDGVRETSFETVVELLALEKVLLVTARVLRICGLCEGEPGSVAEMAAVRTFLSAFLILGHPTQVLSNKDGKAEQEQELVGKARDLLISFETIITRLNSTNNYTLPPALGDALPETYATFHNAFIAWKSRDSDALVEVMLMQFLELDAIWNTVKDSTDDAAMEPYRHSIKEQQVLLMVRIKKLAGPEKGKKLIIEAVRGARKAEPAKKPVGDTKPRVTDNAPPANASAAAQSLISSESHILSPPPTPVPKAKTQPPKPFAVGGLNGLIPDNRIVVHELAINKEYQIPAEEYKEKQHRTFFGSPAIRELRRSVGDGGDEITFGFFKAAAETIGNKLQHLVRPGSSMHTLIQEMFDAEMAEKQFAIGSFSYERFFSAMGVLLPKLCAPVRDDELKELLENKLASGGDLFERIEELSGFIDLMICDYVNYLLRVAAPQLIESAPQYEAKRFADEISQRPDSLVAAEVAWRIARGKVLTEAARRDPEGISNLRSRPSAEKFYSQMLVDVFTQPCPIATERVPEMLQLDIQRIGRLSTQTLRIATAGAILLQCKNLLKRDVRSPWKTEATRILTTMATNGDSITVCADGVMAALEAGRSMPAATKAQIRALTTNVLQSSMEASHSGSEPTESVLRLLLGRLRGHMLQRLAAVSTSEKVKATSTAGEKLASLGLPEFAERVREMVDEIARAGAVDRAAHSVWWEQVADKVASEDAASSSGSASGSAVASG